MMQPYGFATIKINRIRVSLPEREETFAIADEARWVIRHLAHNAETQDLHKKLSSRVEMLHCQTEMVNVKCDHEFSCVVAASFRFSSSSSASNGATCVSIVLRSKRGVMC